MNMRGMFTIASYLRSVMRKTSLRSTSGKLTLLVATAGAFVLVVVGLFAFEVRVPTVSADNVTTSVYVLNTPPNWTVDAQESSPSATTTPTHAGSTQSWVATATDSSNDNYWLIICKTNATPTANISSAPTCGGGSANQWAVSGVTTSGTQATAATTTTEAFPEKNDWVAWICDGNVTLPLCNAAYKTGSGNTASPFVVDHPPVFTSIVNTGAVNPGGTETWTATAFTTDTLRGGDTVKLYVCKAQDFTGATCGAGGTIASSTFAASNPATSTTISIPTQDKTYNAYVYVINNFNNPATSTFEASNSSYVVNNVAPSVSAATISLVDPNTAGNITLVHPNATSGPYKVQFQVSDNNSCLNVSSGQEVASSLVNVYRSGVGSTSCQTSGNYNANNCYPSVSPLTDFSCSQDAGSCTGSTSVTATWTCKFSLWYNADPTDTGSQFSSQNWLATVKVTDDNGSTSPMTEATTGNKVTSFLAFAVNESSLGFGNLQPGQQNDPLATTTTLKELGNVGLDENLYGDTMCPTWSGPDSCDVGGFDATKQIQIANQHAATSSVAYASSNAFTLTGSSSPTLVGIHVPKTTATSTPQSKFTYWGIHIPGTLTVSGNYFGQDTIMAVTSAAANW